MIRFYLLFSILLIALFTAELLQPVQQAVVIPFTEGIAQVSTWLLQRFDDRVSVQGIVIRDISPREIGGPILIGQISGQFARLGFDALISFMAFLSVNLAILNLLPIYPLDGGQISREIFLVVSPREGIRHSLILSMIVAGDLAALAAKRALSAEGWGSWFIVLLFGYLAYSSYAALQAYTSRRPW